jgi:hypothetical protein
MKYKIVTREPKRNALKLKRHMRVAVFFSGRINAYEYSQFSLLELQRKYNNATFFCSLNREETSPYIQRFCDIFSMSDEQIHFEKTVNPEWFAWYEKDPRRAYMYSTLYHNKLAFNLIEAYMEKYGIVFDVILFYRADLLILTKLVDIVPPEKNTVYIPTDQGLVHASPPGVNVFITYGDVDSMKAYAYAVDYLYKYYIDTQGAIYHEGIILQHLNEMNIRIEHLSYECCPSVNHYYDFRLNPKRHDTCPDYT